MLSWLKYLQTRPLPERRVILRAERLYVRSRPIPDQDPLLQAFQDSLEGYADHGAGGRRCEEGLTAQG